MYPLPVVLVGIEDSLLPPLRREFAALVAEIESEFGSASAAADCLRRSKGQPRLLVIQLSEVGQESAVLKLSSTLRGWPILALVSDSDSASELLRLNRAGASQIVPLPLDRDDLHRAAAMVGVQFGAGHVEKHVVAVTGAAGGAGATTLSINLAHEVSSQFPRSTILAEMSLQLGALASMLDLQPKVTLPHLLREIHRVDDYLLERTLVPVTERLRVLAAAQELHSLSQVAPDHLVRIVEYLRKLADITILDLPAGVDETQLELLHACDQILLVGLQTVPSIRAIKMFSDSLPRERVDNSLWVVINRYNPSLKGFGMGELQQMIGSPRLLTIANDYHSVNQAVNRGRPLRVVTPETPILRDIDRLIQQVLGLELPATSVNGNGIFRRMFRSFGKTPAQV